MKPPTEKCKSVPHGNTLPWPTWLERVQLENAVRAQCGEFERILTVEPTNASGNGENYSSLMIRLHVQLKLKDGERKLISFVLKAPHSNPTMAHILHTLQLFPKEKEMYGRILPKLQQLYKDVGKDVQFAPRAFRFDRDVDVDYLLLDDLRTKSFRNANRVTGFDMAHMRHVLARLAQFHAASACYMEHFGMFGEAFTKSFFREENRALLNEFNASGAFLKQLKKWANCQRYYEKLTGCDEYIVDRLLQYHVVRPGEFNVLNHGDCWVNNIMFQYDALGRIKSSLFVDFQVSKYGSPAFDLTYLILSSAAMDIKLTQFDYMIRYYYDHLVENLRLLQYPRPLPKLKNLHTALLNTGPTAFLVTTKTLPLILLEKTNAANLENFMEDESELKEAMYTNPNYVKMMTEILPWLDNRGFLDFK